VRAPAGARRATLTVTDSTGTTARTSVRLRAPSRARTRRRASSGAQGSHYLVGFGHRTIRTDPDGRWKGEPVYLGGYGIGSGPVLEGRPATGVLGDGPDARAVAISDGSRTVILADEQTQGWFAADRADPYGLVDLRLAASRALGGRVSPQEIVVQSDHTHGGADALGAWGGVPLAFRRYMFDQTLEAIVESYRSMRPATLRYGIASGRDLLSNQFDYDAENRVVDSDVRVLQARDLRNRPLVTLLNFSAHATVLGASNTRITGDWPQQANLLMERRFGGRAITVVGTLGRTQPADRGCPGIQSHSGAPGEAEALCALDDYAGRVLDRVAEAVRTAEPLMGDPHVAARSYLIQDPETSPTLLGLYYLGDPIGAALVRSASPPWLTGTILGTVTASARIGDLLLSAMPGEAFPQVSLAVRKRIDARGFMTAGLANDQLGYLIAPYRSYPEPIRRSLFSQRGDEIDPISNDNYTFNVSHTIGQRVECSLLRGAGELFGRGDAIRDADSDCLPFANDAALEPGADAP
jgi:hypothetical protein